MSVELTAPDLQIAYGGSVRYKYVALVLISILCHFLPFRDAILWML